MTNDLDKTVTVPTQLEVAKRLLRHKWVECESLPLIGPVIIHGICEENCYFTSVWFGTEHFFKYC